MDTRTLFHETVKTGMANGMPVESILADVRSRTGLTATEGDVRAVAYLLDDSMIFQSSLQPSTMNEGVSA